MNMPDSHSTGPQAQAAGSDRGTPENVERLLLTLMARLDENDRHYGQALDKLNDRLNTLSQRAQSASAASPAGTTAALERVHEQASSLAAQVSDAGSARRAQQSPSTGGNEQRPGAFTDPIEGGLPPGGTAAVTNDFADVTQRLERSLAAGAPAAGFDSLANRMDDLAHHMDAALDSKSDPGRLQSIEARLEDLARGFAYAQQYYARIENIEGHLRDLMNSAHSANAQANDGNMYARLDAIERALQALNDNPRERDSRAGSTLEALHEAMGSPAPQVGASRGPATPFEDAHPETGALNPPRDTAEPCDTADYADVWIDEIQGGNAEPDPRASRARPASSSDDLGASIPDFQPEPALSREMQSPERRAGKADRRTQMRDRVEPAFEADNDFIASARRAAAAAAAQIPGSGAAEAGAGAPRAARTMPFPDETAQPVPSGSKQPRPFFIAAAAGLLLVSAGILFGQLKNKPQAPATNPVRQEAPEPAAPKTPAADANKRSSLPPAGSNGGKSHSGRIAPDQRPPASAKRAGPVATPATAPPTYASYHPSAAARESLPALQPNQPVSTGTLLSALTREAGRNPLPGVDVTIKEPSGQTPALVPPPAFASRPDLLAPPKRAPAPGTARNRANSQSHPVDSAPGGTVSRSLPSRSVTMPPVRIGPQSLRVAAARGNPAAQVEVASRFAKGSGVAKDLKKAAEWYNRAAAQGFAPAQYRLAALHERGLGVKKDLGLARTWYRRSAELGNIRAMHNLAVLYTRSKPNSPDYTKAKNWFHEAARHGLADSQYNLGILYESGLGVRKNTAEAYKWFTLAARQGDDEARKRREAIRPKLPARSLTAVEQTLRRWKSATPKEAANKAGRPSGGWHNAKLPKAANAAAPALVARAQKLLNKLGYDAGLPDGKLGPKTITAIRRFETRTGTPASGTVTPKLLRQIAALVS